MAENAKTTKTATIKASCELTIHPTDLHTPGYDVKMRAANVLMQAIEDLADATLGVFKKLRIQWLASKSSETFDTWVWELACQFQNTATAALNIPADKSLTTDEMIDICGQPGDKSSDLSPVMQAAARQIYGDTKPPSSLVKIAAKRIQSAGGRSLFLSRTLKPDRENVKAA